MTDLKECNIIDTINNINTSYIIQTPCGKFLIGIEKYIIFRYCLETKQKFRIAGSVDEDGYQDGTRDESRFYSPTSLTLSKDLKTLYVSDTWSRVIRAICVVTGMTTTFAGQVDKCTQVDGPKEKACFYYPKGLKLSSDGNTLIVSDSKKLRTICITTGQVDTIGTFELDIRDFTLSPDSKHVYICLWTQVLKYNIETGKSEIILNCSFGLFGCELSKDGQLLFILNKPNKYIKVVNLIANEVIGTITLLSFSRPCDILLSINNKQLYISDYDCRVNSYNKIQVLDISKYCTNFKIFIQLQLSKHSFLPRQVVKRISI
jgi:DNA-binding beta-propeller fold protein YncE